MKNWTKSGLSGLSMMLVFSLAAISQKADYYESHWQTGLSPKDGEAFIDQMQYDVKSSLMYYLANDDSCLFVYLIISDKASVQKVMRYGLTTWFNPDGKNKKTLGIEFPLPAGEGSGAPARQMGQQQGDRRNMMMGLMAAKNKEMVLTGFSGKGIRDTIQAGESTPFSGHLEMMDREKILVSLTVPVSRIESAGKALPDNLLSVGFETGYMDLNRQGMGQSGGGQQAQEAGGHGGGMYGGPPQGGGITGGTGNTSGKPDQSGQPDISELAKPTRLWISPVRLAEK